ncbi:hypothetical protein ASZ78_000192 [Callipepla squamata]|uniref:Immunoglobulin domain-containing protein n=1 Tax=Callipepla squamata TaxID=9009 RepID=A0A226MBV3_CALSU|nr:hypothetical protein ASZ78_000192 [Callipepla squamata]
MAVVLIFVPRPSLSLHPSLGGLSLRGSFTLRCHVPSLDARVLLYQNQRWISYKEKKKGQTTVDFHFLDINLSHLGVYWCQYSVLNSRRTSAKSNLMEVLVTGEGRGDPARQRVVSSGPPRVTSSPLRSDHSYPQPGISLSPEGQVRTGANVVIRCWNHNYGGTIFLHKDGRLVPILHQVPDVRGTAAFTIFGVTPADGGTYRCSYRPGGFYFLSSPLGDGVTLKVTPAPKGDVSVVGVGVGAAIAVFILALIIVIVVVFFFPDALPCRIWADPTPQSPEAVQLQVLSSEGLTYAELQAKPHSALSPPAAPQTPVIYAEVCTGRPH